jgi:LacI family transcriptional regulator
MDGFLITPSPGLEEDIKMLKEEHRAVVLIDRYFPGLDTSYVTVDNYKGALDATNYLLSKGHKNIGLVTIDSEQVQMQNRFNGFADAMAGKGLVVKEENILRLSFQMGHSESVSRICAFISSAKPEAIFFTTNYLGVYGLESIRINGLNMPADLGMVCFDDHDLFRLGSPAVSVVAQPIEAIARQAVISLIDQLKNKGGDQEQVKIMLKPSLIKRDT